MIWPLLSNKIHHVSLVLLASIILIGCASKSLNEVPAPLPDELPTTAKLDIEWWHILGEEFSDDDFGEYKPVVFDGLVYTALPSGEVFVLDSAGEKKLLGKHTHPVVSPLAVDALGILLADAEGVVTHYDQNFGIKWQSKLNAISTAQVTLSDERVFVQTLDGRVTAIERITGRVLWSYQDSEPGLTLTGTSTPVLSTGSQGTIVVTGLANGKLIALNAVDGNVVWEYRITRATGKTDVSRLVDVDPQVVVTGNRLIATGYQGDLVVVDKASGRVQQARPFSTYRSILVSDEAWFGVDSSSHLVAFDPTTLEEKWRNEQFSFRQLSELVSLDGKLLVADAEGFLHVLSQESGEWLGSRHIDWRGKASDPVLYKDGVLVQGLSSRLKYIKLN